MGHINFVSGTTRYLFEISWYYFYNSVFMGTRIKVKKTPLALATPHLATLRQSGI